jgi:hypothetical protein
MGGEVFVGVRDRDKKEYLMLRHTNEMPSWLINPNFYMSGASNEQEFKSRISGAYSLQTFLARAKPKNQWPKAKLIKTITSSEYGVILIDFPNRQIFSRQGYCHVGGFNLSLFSSGFVDDAVSVVTSYELGWVKSVHVLEYGGGKAGKRVFGKDEVDQLMKMCRGDVATQQELENYFRDKGLITIDYCPENWTIDDKNDRAGDCWPTVKAWLKANEWKSKTRNGR